MSAPSPTIVNTILVAIIAAAAALRVFVASAAPYLPDERELAIPLAESISLSPSALHLPIRGKHHPALPSYFIKASIVVAGRSPVGYRLMHVLAGLATILLVFRMTALWAGPVAALWSSALLAFNEYHIGVSSFATAKGAHLFLLVLALWAFVRFLSTERPVMLALAAGMTGLAFYCKEHSALVLPVFFLTLCHPRYRPWLRRRHPYLAGIIFLIVIAPDIAWNLNQASANAAGQATYGDHLSRIGGLGFTTHYLMFFARGVVQLVNVTVTGAAIEDPVLENPSMNSAIGVLLLGTMIWWTVKMRPKDEIGRFLMALFWFVFGFFVLVRPGRSIAIPMDAVAWYWVDAILFPAVMVTGLVLARASDRLRPVLWAAAIAALLYGSFNTIALPGRLPDILLRSHGSLQIDAADRGSRL